MNDAWTVSPSGTTDVSEAVTVAIDGRYIVLRPSTVVDRPSTRAFVQALSGALTTGSIVRIDLGIDDDEHTRNPSGRDRLTRDVWCPIRGPVEQVAAGLEREPSEFTFHVIAAGVIGVHASGSWWMIDIERHRFCRTAAPIDLRFLDGTAWCRVRAIWISESMISVLTSDGSYVTTARATIDHEVDSQCLHAS